MSNERKEEVKLYQIQIQTNKASVTGFINTPMDNNPDDSALIDNYINNSSPDNDTSTFLATWRSKSWLIEGIFDEFCVSDFLDTFFDPANAFYKIDRSLTFDISNAQQQGLLHEVFYETSGNVSTAYIKYPDGQKKYVNPLTSPSGLQLLFTFRVNPNHLNVQKKKLFTKIRTKGGFEFQHWGPDISEIEIEGITGNLRASGIGIQNINVGPVSIPAPFDRAAEEFPTEQNSPAYAAFRQLEKLYDDDQNDSKIENNQRLAIEYRGRIYVGHLQNFSYTEIATRPFLFEYKLSFLVHYEATSEAGAKEQAKGDITRNEETLQRIRQIQEDKNRSLDITIQNASSNTSK